MAKSYSEIRAEIDADIYENQEGKVTATNINKDLQDIVDKVEEVQFQEAPANNTQYARKNKAWVEITHPSITVDTAMSDTSENAVQNKVIKAYADTKVNDVKVNGASVVDTDKVANIPLGSVSQSGVVNGSTINSPVLCIGINESGTLTAEAATAAKAGVIHDAPAAEGSYVRKRDSSGAATWALAADGSDAVKGVKVNDTELTKDTEGKVNIPVAAYDKLGVVQAGAKGTNDVQAITVGDSGMLHAKLATGTSAGVVQLTTSTSSGVSSDTSATTPGYVKKAIEALDVDEVGGDGKFIQKISEVDGKISATAVDIDVAMSDTSTNPVQNKVAKAYADTKIAEVKLNGTALTPTAGAVNIPVASTSDLGVVKVEGGVPENRTTAATSVHSGTLYVANASKDQVGVVTIGDNIVVTDPSQGKISVPDASNTVKGVINDIPAQGSGATEDKKFVRVAKQDGTIAWEESASSGVSSIKVGPSGTAMTGDVVIPVATSTTNGVCKVGLLTPTSTDPVASSTLCTEFDKKLEGVKMNDTDLTVTNKKVNIPVASESSFGVVKTATAGYTPMPVVSAGTGGVLYVDSATKDASGVVQVGDNINVSSGKISVPKANYTTDSSLTTGVITPSEIDTTTGSWTPDSIAVVDGKIYVANAGAQEGADSRPGVMYDIPDDATAPTKYARYTDAAGNVSWQPFTLPTVPVKDAKIAGTSASLLDGTTIVIPVASSSNYGVIQRVKASSALPSTLAVNVIYNLGDVTSITEFSLPSVSLTIEEFIIEFTATVAFTFPALPSGCKWQNGTAPTITAGHMYTIKIRNYRASYSEFY